jgi:hypothetical protein
MNSKELDGLAKATCCWMAYRHLIDADSLYERLLIIPITEYLAARTNWKPENESSYRKIFTGQSLPDYYADIWAKMKGGNKQFILETKLLRAPATRQWSNIQSDVCRLGKPEGKVARYFMLAGLKEFFNIPATFKSEKPSEIFKRLLLFEYKEGFEAHLDGSGRRYVRLCSDACVSVRNGASYRVVVWSISMPSAALSTR